MTERPAPLLYGYETGTRAVSDSAGLRSGMYILCDSHGPRCQSIVFPGRYREASQALGGCGYKEVTICGVDLGTTALFHHRKPRQAVEQLLAQLAH
ncbi:MAG: hypothetical protein CM1200mP41_19040 [Gammaproteobacteria bacterium]|nr:MAG: hypothetical protein CM1200mP41_19040 [Gammaproteobacteria bacterium]